MYSVKKSNIHRIQVRLERDLLQGSFSDFVQIYACGPSWRGYQPGAGWREVEKLVSGFYRKTCRSSFV
eukprot:COSAG02_NODE_4283_length_5550_cov_3.230050_1_plen_67_part_10